ncbi:hypothetical protein D3C84_913660 [compost metagenome]
MSGLASNKAICLANLCDKLISSPSILAIYSPFANFKPIFKLFVKPVFNGFFINLILLSLYVLIISIVLSVDASSIIKNSKSLKV